MVVGMSGFILGPVLGGTALAAFPWERLLVVNAPIEWIGVRLGVSADRHDDLTHDALDFLGAALSMAAIGFAFYTLTSGVERGWGTAVTIGCALAAALGVLGFIWRERRAAAPMLDPNLFRSGTVRGAALAQLGGSIAMAAVMFGLILHFQYAYGWSPVVAGLANLPMILTMLAAQPISELLARRHGHRIACVVGAVLLAGSLARSAPSRWSTPHARQPHLDRHRAQRHRPRDR